MRSMLTPLLFMALATPALASDGVLEISQTCAVETGCFPGDTAGLPVTITAPGSYVLTSNLIVPDENTSGIVIDTSDVGIDLNDFAIIRSGCEGATDDCTPASGTGSGVVSTANSHRGLSVKNGSVTGMGEYGVWLGEQADVTNLRVRWNRVAGISAAAASTVSGNTAFQNGIVGIFASNGSMISGNTAYENGDRGIDASSGCAVIGNAAYRNGDFAGSTGDGIECNSGCIVRGNSVRFNRGYGLDLGTDSAYSDNVVTNNGVGPVTGAASANSRGGNYCAGTGTVSSFCP